MSKVAGVLVALLIVGIVTTRGAHASRLNCPGTTTSSTHGSTRTTPHPATPSTATPHSATRHTAARVTTAKQATPGK